jgi:hypothetical protein
MPYTSGVSFTGVKSASSGWEKPQRLNVDARGRVVGLAIKASTSSISQFDVQIGYGWAASAASAYMMHPLYPAQYPAAAGAWNVSSVTSATTFIHRTTFNDNPVDYDFTSRYAAPFIFSGSDLRTSAGLYVAIRPAAGALAAGVTVSAWVDVTN